MIPKRDEMIEAEKKSLQKLRSDITTEKDNLNKQINNFEADKAQSLKSIELERDLNLKSIKNSIESLNRLKMELKQKEEVFSRSFLEGRNWLIDLISEAKTARDLQYVSYLNNKKRPAPSTAKEIKDLIKNKNKKLIKKNKSLEYQVKTYHEYFPLLEEYEDAILDEVINFKEDLSDQDNTLKYLTTDEYKKLPEDKKNQLALDRYTNNQKNNVQIGLFYERYIGYLFEQAGWNVNYQGALAGRLDRGIDLVCTKGDIVKLVQCKCWSKNKKIYEKYIFQLFGVLQYSIYSNNFGVNKTVNAELIITNNLGDFAEHMAELLNIEVKQLPLKKDYPKIKCTTSVNGEKLYHLPMDQQYDKILMNSTTDRFYAHTVKEATSKGHRRAFRYQFDK